MVIWKATLIGGNALAAFTLIWIVHRSAGQDSRFMREWMNGAPATSRLVSPDGIHQFVTTKCSDLRDRNRAESPDWRECTRRFRVELDYVVEKTYDLSGPEWSSVYSRCVEKMGNYSACDNPHVVEIFARLERRQRVGE